CKAKKGKVKFYSFYRDFLLVLFHKGLNEPPVDGRRLSEVEIEIGKIPYLNGGLFDEHELEKTNAGIDIDDKAFEHLFDFFDQYEWHLDTRHTASGKDINPDVIGYIFEKYINDRANMGAYYTKEDITDYISKNCILPYLFDETKRHCPKAFNADAELWQMVKQSGDQYIYDAVKKGVEEPLPKEIEQGIKDVSKRTKWNTSASHSAPHMALPTEIWREVGDRRNRYNEVKSKIDKGDIQQINDFITYNLNIRQYAQDVVENTDDPELLRHFYKALNSVTIIDPTCGSGAFLFAAMNILETLYESCLQRMENFVAEAPKGKYKFFEETLVQVKSPEHPNLQYFIYKSIILRNLYGVDIMKEAVEIAKLRLFLKLVATVEADYRKPNLGLEPLPDIDFNIRAGNTLVGFATEAELANAFVGTLDFDNSKDKLEEKCEVVANTFKRYKEIQLTYGDDFKEFKKAKAELNKRLKELNHELNQLLHKQASGLKYENWLKTHQPFHWFAEYYEILQGDGGFDVVIGNPPYVELKKVGYNLQNYSTENCGNLYALVIERYFSIIRKEGRSGMIIPHSSICTDRMKSLMKVFSRVGIWLSSFDIRPSKLFEGVDQRLLIYLTDFNSKDVNTSKYHRWSGEFRSFLFPALEYVSNIKNSVPNSLIKANKEIEKSIINKIRDNKTLSHYYQSSSNLIYYHNAPRYFIRVMNKTPYFWNEKDGEKVSTQVKSISFGEKERTYAVGATLNSNLFYWWFILQSDSRHLNNREIDYFPFSISELNEKDIQLLSTLFEKLNNDFEKNKYRKNAYYKATGNVEYDEYYPKKSKPIIDEIDTVLAKHYGFTDEELDFIINYDIKYRMGKELENEDEE
ncbi:MAG: Eco57I restriction-modification methylase domain-containing protein, partial [Pyrinomonadaceae bacterium]